MVRITERLVMDIPHLTVEQAQSAYRNGEIVLGSEDFCGVRFDNISDYMGKEDEITEPDFTYLRKLIKDFHPAERGIISCEEMEKVEDVLLLKSRNILSLRNLRNLVVAVLDGRVKDYRANYDIDQELSEMDRISAITHVIDKHIFERGGEP